jgi:hypothetical protein
VDAKDSVTYLRSPKAIREQCGRIFDLAEAGRLASFTYDAAKLPAVADFVLQVTREAYPTLDVPYHSRWRHFDAGDVPRLAQLDAKLAGKTPEEIAMAKCELAIVSVLLDAGAGMKWQYRDGASGKTYSKSEGLAVASFDMFMAGAFSSEPDDPCRVDPAGLRAVGRNELAAGFQATAQNPLAGLDGRLGLLQKLGSAVASGKKHFGDREPRLGGLALYLAKQAGNGKLPARKILGAVLDALGPIWPGRIAIGGVNLGDVWRHSALPEDDLGHGLVPFHKLSQWLTYSLMEPLEELGLVINDVDELTGLPEYRNGGLFVDLGVLVPKHPGVLADTHKPDSEVIVEWRALTVVLLDRVADLIRAKLGRSAEELPLAKVLQGGTWTAGRRVAQERRADGGPPIKLASDGTVF